MEFDQQCGRELKMMLSGEKLLAAFFQDDLISEFDALDGQNFDPWVESGKIIRREIETELNGIWVKYILFAPASEAWRIEAYLVLLEFRTSRSWTPELEWVEARIYGLPPEQCDRLVKHRYK